jgi:hypothetical protein
VQINQSQVHNKNVNKPTGPNQNIQPPQGINVPTKDKQNVPPKPPIFGNKK